MKNTGITYTSAERSPVILPEMAELLPPLSAEQLDALEADLIKNGCYAPIIVNEDMVIIDGHNRQALCEKHDLPYTMAVFSFEDLLEAKQWALDTQKGRRNLEKWELGKIALKLKPEIEAKAKANMAAGGQNFRPSEAEEGSATLPNLPSVEKAVDTRKELAEAVGLGERTMGKVMQIDENAPDAIKEALDKKELSINKGYDLTRQLQDVPEDQREQAAAELLEYEKAKKDLKQQNAEIDRRGKVANLFCEVNENIKAYGVASHRHTPEIEEQLGYAAGEKVVLNFTPHLVPMNRGILATEYAKLTKKVTYEEVKAIYDKYYADETFIRVLDKDVCPQTKCVEGSNYVDVNFKIDSRTKRVIMMGAIDNLVKGAAGQAVQNMNLMFGFDEAEGLHQIPMLP